MYPYASILLLTLNHVNAQVSMSCLVCPLWLVVVAPPLWLVVVAPRVLEKLKFTQLKKVTIIKRKLAQLKK